MNPEGFINVYNTIKYEIIRFESVHPAIYALYELIERLENEELALEMKNNVLTIEDAFVNSQEWSLSRLVPDVRVGVIGSANSGKSSLVHRYLTGTYVTDDSPEGGRFKKCLFAAGENHLMLLRDEADRPDVSFIWWVDVVILAFSLEDEDSFQLALQYYNKIYQLKPDLDIPLFFIGTQDAISETRPRVIVETRARKAAADMRNCIYYETNATYGRNVDHVFQEACIRVSQHRQKQATLFLTNATRGVAPNNNSSVAPTQFGGTGSASGSWLPPGVVTSCTTGQLSQQQASLANRSSFSSSNQSSNCPSFNNAFIDSQTCISSGVGTQCEATNENIMHPAASFSIPTPSENLSAGPADQLENDPPTPSGTPTQNRRGRRKSNIFRRHDDDKEDRRQYATVGSGRQIPIKQGLLYKERKGINKDWRKKYVAIHEDGSFVYYNTIKDYQENYGGKTIHLTKVSIKLPGVACRSYGTEGIRNNFPPPGSSVTAGSSTVAITAALSTVPVSTCSTSLSATVHTDSPSPNSSNSLSAPGTALGPSTLTSSQLIAPTQPSGTMGLGAMGAASHNLPDNSHRDGSKKKLHRRMKSSAKSHSEYQDCEFSLVTVDNRSHRFLSECPEDRKSWLEALDKVQMLFYKNVPADKIMSCGPVLSTAAHQNHCFTAGFGAATNAGNNGNSTNVFQFPVVGRDKFDKAAVTSNSQVTNNLQFYNDESIHGSFTLRAGSVSLNMSAHPLARVAGDRVLLLLRQVAGNDKCVDCSELDPEWASYNLGVVLCINCCGRHRSLGTHISRVRAINLDDWSRVELEVMVSVGNTLANSVWEAGLPAKCAQFRKPTTQSTSEEREQWVQAKYKHRMFIPPLPYGNAPRQQQLIDAIARKDTRQVILVLVSDVMAKFVNEAYSPQDTRMAIHIAATIGSLVYLQLLFWTRSIDPNVHDGDGRNAYFYATAAQQRHCAEFLAYNGCRIQRLAPPGMVLPLRQQQQQSITSHIPLTPTSPAHSSNKVSLFSVQQQQQHQQTPILQSTSARNQGLVNSGATLPRRRPNISSSQQLSANDNAMRTRNGSNEVGI